MPAWYKEENPDWKTDLQPTVIERQLKDALNKKQCNWTPGKPGRPPAWAVGYLQKEKAEKEEEPSQVGKIGEMVHQLSPRATSLYMPKQERNKRQAGLVVPRFIHSSERRNSKFNLFVFFLSLSLCETKALPHVPVPLGTPPRTIPPPRLTSNLGRGV